MVFNKNMDIFFGIILLIILDLVLSIDNAILIASVTKNLEAKDKKIAQFLGAFFAVLMRLIFILLLLALFNLIKIPAIYIAGGALLIFLGISLTKEKKEEKVIHSKSNVVKAVFTIIITDLIMSFDNAFIIVEIVLNFDFDKHGLNNVFVINAIIIAIALLISLIIIVFFANYLSELMNKNFWIMFIASWLLVSLGIEMMLKDSFWNIFSNNYDFSDEELFFIESLNEWGVFLISHFIGGLIALFLYFRYRKQKPIND